MESSMKSERRKVVEQRFFSGWKWNRGGEEEERRVVEEAMQTERELRESDPHLVIAVISRRGVLGYQEGNTLFDLCPLLRLRRPRPRPRSIPVPGVLKLLGATPPPVPQIPRGRWVTEVAAARSASERRPRRCKTASPIGIASQPAC
ncbi:hypothetical protein ACLB2K_063333 [Fragaria x ananassa]